MKLLVLDGNSIINRAYYGVRPLTTKDGFFTNAIFGFLTMFHKIYEDTRPDAIAVAFDLKAPTFRHLRYSDYKGKRKGMPPELAMQLEPLKELLTAMGLKLLSAEGWEADDILGTLAEACRKNPEDSCVIATGDRDTLQLVGDGVAVRMLTTKQGKAEAVIYDEETILETYGVKPIQLIEVKAIQGDTSDNIPGVPGIGEKGALDLVQRFGSLDYIYTHIDTIDVKPGIRKKLVEGKESAYLSRWLGTVSTQAPVPTDISEYVLTPPDVEKVTEIMLRLELFKSLEKMKKDWFGNASSSAVKTANADNLQTDAAADVQFCKDIDSLIAQIKTDGELFFLPDSKLKQICGARNGTVTVVTEENNGVEAFCRAVLSDDTVKKYTFDIKSVLHALTPLNILPQHCECDVMLAAYILNPSSDCEDPDKLAAQYASPLPDNMPAELHTALLCLRLPAMCARMLAEIENNGQKSLLHDIEIPLAYVLADMERTGFSADRAALDEFEQRLSVRVSELTSQIYALAGEEFNLNSPKQIGSILFDKMGLPGGKKTKIFCDPDLSLLTPGGVHPLLEGVQLAAQSGEADGSDDIRQLGGLQSIIEIERADAGHGAGAVGDAKAFLADQRIQNGNPRQLHRLGAVVFHALKASPAAAQQNQPHVTQRSQIARGAERALLRDDGGNAAVEHLREHRDQQRTNAADADAEGVGAQQHHAADLLVGIGIARADSMTQNQVGGKLCAHILRDGHVCKITEAGGDAVGHALFPGNAVS